ncbi:MAG: hypothetical protein NC541_08535 [bacterium]|nr:hypothetical protein [bacterium]
MQLVNYVTTRIPNLPSELSNKITFVGSTPLETIELQIFDICLKDIAEILKKDGLLNGMFDLIVVFSADGSFGFIPKTIGQGKYARIAVYNMREIRKLRGADQVAFVFTEELVHHFWNCENETKTKLKVIEILQLTEPKITKEYVETWEINWE